MSSRPLRCSRSSRNKPASGTLCPAAAPADVGEKYQQIIRQGRAVIARPCFFLYSIRRKVPHMSSTRMGRINEEIQRALSDLIRTVKDPRVQGLISVTAVETTADLKYAKIYISVLDKSNANDVLKGLKSASGYLRRELGHALSLRSTPELTFLRDDSIDKGAHILEIIERLEQ